MFAREGGEPAVFRRILVICVFGAFLAVGAPPAQAHGHHGHHHRGFLFTGTDTEEFHGALNGPDRLGRFRTDGPNVVGGRLITTSYPINGMADAGGFLYSGTPRSSTIRKISYSGALLGSVVAGFAPSCCSEDMIVAGRSLYHAHYPAAIEKLDATTGVVIQTYAQSSVVGMTFVTRRDEDEDDDDGHQGDRHHHSTTGRTWSHHRHHDHGREIWISKWGPKQVGTWDPHTNTFTPRFTTPNLAGGLAWDGENKVLWVGMAGGMVVPYRLSGTPYNAGFQPFGPIGDTVDGLEFVDRIHGHHH
jgi:hypothetical protein